jgi:hypothetical protein
LSDDKIPIHKITLSFTSDELQYAFHRYFFVRSIKLIRIALIVAAVLYTLYNILDHYVVPDIAHKILQIRILGSTLFFAIFVFSFTTHFRRHYQSVLSLSVVLGGFGIIWMIFVSETAGGFYYYAGIMLAIMFAHGLFRLRFINASISTWIVVVAYEFFAIVYGITPREIVINNTFFLLSANIVGMFTSYGLEYYVRTVFWQTRVLDSQKRELEREHERKARELEEARRIQLAMLPKVVPHHPYIDLAVCMKTATEVGGDFYDFHLTEDYTLTFAVGDATGHGAHAGVMVTATKILFANLAAEREITDILRKSSASIRRMGLPKLYMAFAVGRLHGEKLEIAGAGLPPALIYRSAENVIEKVPLKGVPLGSFADIAYKKKNVTLSPGDAVLIMTDGLAEMHDSKGTMYGYENVVRLYTEVAAKKPEEMIHQFQKVLQSWSDGLPQQDDITILVMKMKAREDSSRNTEAARVILR